MNRNDITEKIITVKVAKLLRQYFPKKTNFLKVSQTQVDDALYLLNHRPRKCLGYLTPHEVFYALKMQPITLPFVALCT